MRAALTTRPLSPPPVEAPSSGREVVLTVAQNPASPTLLSAGAVAHRAAVRRATLPYPDGEATSILAYAILLPTAAPARGRLRRGAVPETA